jgi:hypothetical protein
MADPVPVVHFFEPLEWSAQLGGGEQVLRDTVPATVVGLDSRVGK